MFLSFKPFAEFCVRNTDCIVHTPILENRIFYSEIYLSYQNMVPFGVLRKQKQYHIPWKILGNAGQMLKYSVAIMSLEIIQPFY